MNKLIENGLEYLGADVSTRKKLIEYYNENCFELVRPNRRYRMKLGDDWCAMFTSVLAHKSGLSNTQFPYEVSVFYQCEQARAWGTYSENLDYLKVGDLLIFDWGRGNGYNHVGVVKEISNGRIYTLEGNYNNTVGIRSIAKNSGAIRGTIAIDNGVNDVESDRILKLAKAVLRGEFGNGRERALRLGDDYHKVQKMVNLIMK